MTSEIRANTLKNRVGLGTISFTDTGPVVSGIITTTGDVYLGNDIYLTDGSGGYEQIEVSVNDIRVKHKHIHSEFGVWTRSTSVTDRKNGIESGGNDLRLYSNSTEKVRINSTGEVGIGTDNPTFELELRKTGQADLLIGSYNAGGARLMLDGDSNGDGSGGDFCEILADTSGDLTINARNPASNANMIFKVGDGTEKLRITSDGKVGINRNNPDALLHIFNSGTSVLPLKVYRNDVGDVPIVHFQGYNNAIGVVDKFVVTTRGRVGVNTDNPQRELHIKPSDNNPATAVPGYIRVEGNGSDQAAILELYHTRGNGSDKWPSSVASVDGGLTLNVANGNNGAPQEKVRITSSGKVGIATNNPTYPLHILSDANALIRLESTDANSGIQFVDSNTGNKPPVIYGVGDDITLWTDWIERLRIASSGNIGIGENNPQSILHIEHSTPGIRLGDTGNSSAYAFFDANAANAIIHADKGNSVSNSRVAFAVDNAEKVRITSSGMVLIGETSVAGGSQKLVVGNGGAENFEFTPAVSTYNGGVLEYIHRGDGSTRPDLSMYVGDGAFKVYTGGNNQRLRIHHDGQSEFKADNSNSHFTVGNSSGTMTILDTTTPSAIGVGGRIVFGSTYYNAGSTMGGASIGSYKKENPSNGVGEYRHYLNFHTRNENGIRERVRIDEIGHLSLRNELNSAREIQWWNEVSGSAKAASIGWGNGNANWEFKHFRNDNQADNPYANIDFFTGDYASPTRALRITNDGNHIREKHSRFATRIIYSAATEAAGVKLTFYSPHVNIGSDFSSSRYTAPVDGTYAFWFFTNVAKSGGGSYYATWKINGSEQSSSKGARIYDQHSGSGWNNISGCIMLNLQEGDYVEVYNGSQVVNYDGDHYGQFMGWLVG